MESPLRHAAPPDLEVIETFGWRPGTGFLRLPAHLARMSRGAAALGARFDRGAVDRALAGIGGEAALRVRLSLRLDGTLAARGSPLGANGSEWRVVVATARLRSDDPWLRLKTSRRDAFDTARAQLPAGIDEALLLNERGEVCEGTITSVFAEIGAGLLTPPLACGLLPGVLRAEMLARGTCREAVLRIDDLARARLFVGNSLRGLIPARLVARA